MSKPKPTLTIKRVQTDQDSYRKEWWKWVYGGQRNPLNDVKYEKDRNDRND